jgi:hypothetical protein
MRNGWSRSLGAVIALGAISLAGCYKVQMVSNANVSGGKAESAWTHFFVFGLVGDASVDVRDFCGEGEASVVETSLSFLNGLSSAVTLGIWTPRTVTVTCADSGRAARSVKILATADGRPQAFETMLDGRPLRGELRPTAKAGVLMASLPAAEVQ